MVAYFLKSGVCLALLLFFYHLVLEREKMHHFNRFYLLGSMFFSFLAPLFVIYTKAPLKIIGTMQTTVTNAFVYETVETPISYWSYFASLSIFISSILLIRFIKNIVSIYKKTKKNPILKHKKATLVLVDDAINPHTFWNYIFINKEAYYAQKIEEELFTHELTHALQKHTFDVLLVEFLKIIFWFNPIFYFLKKTIQLNHEFLADTKVIANHKNISEYQYLLLNKTAWNNEYYLASNLNYLLTKKRLLMMTKQSSRTKIVIKKLAVIPVLVGFTFLFAERVEAETNDYLDSEITTQTSKPNTLSSDSALLKDINKKLKEANSLKLSIKEKDSLPKTDSKRIINLKKGTITYSKKGGKKITKNFTELTEDEMKMIPPPPPSSKTGFYENNGKKLYYIQKGKALTFYNKHGQIVTKKGIVINSEQTKSTNLIHGQNITKVYKDSKVVANFKRTNLPPPPSKANFPEVKKGDISNIPPPPPPIKAEKLISKYPNATYYFNNKKVSRNKVLALVKNKKGLSVLTQEQNNQKVIKFTTKDKSAIKYYINGKLSSKKKLEKIAPKNIKSINVKKGENGNGAIYLISHEK